MGTGESTVAECHDGSLYRNDRPIHNVWNQTEGSKRRWVSRGSMNALPSPVPDENLPDPAMSASLVSLMVNGTKCHLFTNSVSTFTRLNMTIRMSCDCGYSWPRARQLYIGNSQGFFSDMEAMKKAGKGGYSSTITFGGSKVIALIESGHPEQYTIDVHEFDLEWLTGEH